MDSNQRILHDAYFSKTPRFTVLWTVRLVLLCLLSVSAVLVMTDLYDFPCGRGTAALISFAATAAVYLLASVLPPAAVCGSIAVTGGVLGFIFRESITELALMFWDYMMLKLDSRILSTKPFMTGDTALAVSGAPDDAFAAGVLFGITAISVLLAIVTVAFCRSKCRVFPPVFLAVLLCAPAFAAEIAHFTPFIIAFVSSALALRSISASYALDSSFVFDKADASRRAEKKSERSYRKKTRFWAFSKKLRSDLARYGKYTANAAATVVIAAGVFTAAMYIVPKERGLSYQEMLDAVSDLWNSATEQIGEFWNNVTGRADERNYFSISGGLGNTDDISLSSPSESEREVMRVTLDRNDVPVFLRGDIGMDYTGDGWTSVSTEYDRMTDWNGEKYSERIGGFYPEEEYQRFRLGLLKILDVSPDEVIPLQKVSIEYLRNTRVVFQPLAPYDLNYRDSEYFDVYGDFILRMKPKNGYISEFESMALTPRLSDSSFTAGGFSSDFITRSAQLFDKDAQDRGEYEYLGNIDTYRDYIMDAYLRSDDVITDLSRVLWTTDVLSTENSRYENVTNVCDYFRKNYSYTLDRNESGGSLDDFLYKTKKGHCALFASAMTLVLRSADIPARYVTGYVVSGEGEKTDDGYSYTLRERDLHAWVEVYFRGVGWLPFDPTAADTSSGAGVSEITPDAEDTPPDDKDEPDEPDTEPDAPDEEDVPDDHEDNAPQGAGEEDTEPQQPAEGGFPTEYLPIVIAAAAIIIAAVAAVLFVNAVERAEKRTFENFRRRSPTESTALMYRFILVLLSGSGLVPQNEMLYEFAKRVDGDISMKGINLFLSDIIGVFEKCEFGTEEISPVTEDERKAVYKFAAALYVRTLDRTNPVKQFFVKISLFM